MNEERWAIWLNSIDGSENGKWYCGLGSYNPILFSSKERAEKQMWAGIWIFSKPEPRRYS